MLSFFNDAKILSPCMGISDEIDDATITIHETTILEILKSDNLTQTIFQKSSFSIKFLFRKSSRDN